MLTRLESTSMVNLGGRNEWMQQNGNELEITFTLHSKAFLDSSEAKVLSFSLQHTIYAARMIYAWFNTIL
jgi:hypothetical protein